VLLNIVITFKQIAKYPDYWISAQGTIKRAARTLNTTQGVRYRPERIIVLQRRSRGVEVTLWKEGCPHCASVSACLLETWGPPKPNVHNTAIFAGHLDSDPYNIELSNLCWMTKQQIRQRMLQNGRCK
jgi:hypothetical protein